MDITSVDLPLPATENGEKNTEKSSLYPDTEEVLLIEDYKEAGDELVCDNDDLDGNLEDFISDEVVSDTYLTGNNEEFTPCEVVSQKHSNHGYNSSDSDILSCSELPISDSKHCMSYELNSECQLSEVNDRNSDCEIDSSQISSLEDSSCVSNVNNVNSFVEVDKKVLDEDGSKVSNSPVLWDDNVGTVNAEGMAKEIDSISSEAQEKVKDAGVISQHSCIESEEITRNSLHEDCPELSNSPVLCDSNSSMQTSFEDKTGEYDLKMSEGQEELKEEDINVSHGENRVGTSEVNALELLPEESYEVLKLGCNESHLVHSKETEANEPQKEKSELSHECSNILVSSDMSQNDNERAVGSGSCISSTNISDSLETVTASNEEEPPNCTPASSEDPSNSIKSLVNKDCTPHADELSDKGQTTSECNSDSIKTPKLFNNCTKLKSKDINNKRKKSSPKKLTTSPKLVGKKKKVVANSISKSYPIRNRICTVTLHPLNSSQIPSLNSLKKTAKNNKGRRKPEKEDSDSISKEVLPDLGEAVSDLTEPEKEDIQDRGSQEVKSLERALLSESIVDESLPQEETKVNSLSSECSLDTTQTQNNVPDTTLTTNSDLSSESQTSEKVLVEEVENCEAIPTEVENLNNLVSQTSPDTTSISEKDEASVISANDNTQKLINEVDESEAEALSITPCISQTNFEEKDKESQKNETRLLKSTEIKTNLEAPTPDSKVLENTSASLIDEEASEEKNDDIEKEKKKDNDKIMDVNSTKKVDQVIDSNNEAKSEVNANLGMQRERRRSLPKLSFRMKHDMQEQCCGHWYPNKKHFIRHLTDNSEEDTNLESLHTAKLIDLGLQKCLICSIWLSAALLKRHRKKEHEAQNSNPSQNNAPNSPPRSDEASLDDEKDQKIPDPKEKAGPAQKVSKKTEKLKVEIPDPKQKTDPVQKISKKAEKLKGEGQDSKLKADTVSKITNKTEKPKVEAALDPKPKTDSTQKVSKKTEKPKVEAALDPKPKTDSTQKVTKKTEKLKDELPDPKPKTDSTQKVSKKTEKPKVEAALDPKPKTDSTQKVSKKTEKLKDELPDPKQKTDPVQKVSKKTEKPKVEAALDPKPKTDSTQKVSKKTEKLKDELPDSKQKTDPVPKILKKVDKIIRIKPKPKSKRAAIPPEKPCPMSKKRISDACENDERIICDLSQDPHSSEMSIAIYSMEDLPKRFKPSIIISKCKIKLKKKRLNKRVRLKNHIMKSSESEDESLSSIKKKLNEFKDLSSTISLPALPEEKMSEAGGEIKAKKLSPESKEKSSPISSLNVDKPSKFRKKGFKFKKITKIKKIKKILAQSLDENKSEPNLEDSSQDDPPQKVSKRTRHFSIENTPIQKAFKKRRARRSLDECGILRATPLGRIKIRRGKKRGRPARKRRCGFHSSDSSDGSPEVSDVTSSDVEDSLEDDYKENEENIPTVELDLFTISTFNEDVSVLLIDPKNPNFKVFASMEAIFVGDSALEDVTNQVGYISDNNNVVYVNPSHFLFPNVSDSEIEIPSLKPSKKSQRNLRRLKEEETISCKILKRPSKKDSPALPIKSIESKSVSVEDNNKENLCVKAKSPQKDMSAVESAKDETPKAVKLETKTDKEISLLSTIISVDPKPAIMKLDPPPLTTPSCSQELASKPEDSFITVQTSCKPEGSSKEMSKTVKTPRTYIKKNLKNKMVPDLKEKVIVIKTSMKKDLERQQGLNKEVTPKLLKNNSLANIISLEDAIATLAPPQTDSLPSQVIHSSSSMSHSTPIQFTFSPQSSLPPTSLSSIPPPSLPPPSTLPSSLTLHPPPTIHSPPTIPPAPSIPLSPTISSTPTLHATLSLPTSHSLTSTPSLLPPAIPSSPAIPLPSALPLPSAAPPLSSPTPSPLKQETETVLKTVTLKPVEKMKPNLDSNVSYKLLADSKNPVISNNIDYSSLDTIDVIDCTFDNAVVNSSSSLKEEISSKRASPKKRSVSVSDQCHRASGDLAGTSLTEIPSQLPHISSPPPDISSLPPVISSVPLPPICSPPPEIKNLSPVKVAAESSVVVASAEITSYGTLEGGLCLEDVMEDESIFDQPDPVPQKASPAAELKEKKLESPLANDKEQTSATVSQDLQPCLTTSFEEDTLSDRESSPVPQSPPLQDLGDIVKGNSLWSTPLLFSPVPDIKPLKDDLDGLPLNLPLTPKVNKKRGRKSKKSLSSDDDLLGIPMSQIPDFFSPNKDSLLPFRDDVKKFMKNGPVELSPNTVSAILSPKVKNKSKRSSAKSSDSLFNDVYPDFCFPNKLSPTATSNTLNFSPLKSPLPPPPAKPSPKKSPKKFPPPPKSPQKPLSPKSPLVKSPAQYSPPKSPSKRANNTAANPPFLPSDSSPLPKLPSKRVRKPKANNPLSLPPSEALPGLETTSKRRHHKAKRKRKLPRDPAGFQPETNSLWDESFPQESFEPEGSPSQLSDSLRMKILLKGVSPREETSSRDISRRHKKKKKHSKKKRRAKEDLETLFGPGKRKRPNVESQSSSQLGRSGDLSVNVSSPVPDFDVNGEEWRVVERLLGEGIRNKGFNAKEEREEASQEAKEESPKCNSVDDDDDEVQEVKRENSRKIVLKQFYAFDMMPVKKEQPETEDEEDVDIENVNSESDATVLKENISEDKVASVNISEKLKKDPLNLDSSPSHSVSVDQTHTTQTSADEVPALENAVDLGSSPESQHPTFDISSDVDPESPTSNASPSPKISTQKDASSSLESAALDEDQPSPPLPTLNVKSSNQLVDDRFWHSRGAKLKAQIMISDRQRGIMNSTVEGEMKLRHPKPDSRLSMTPKIFKKSKDCNTKDIRSYFTSPPSQSNKNSASPPESSPLSSNLPSTSLDGVTLFKFPSNFKTDSTQPKPSPASAKNASFGGTAKSKTTSKKMKPSPVHTKKLWKKQNKSPMDIRLFLSESKMKKEESDSALPPLKKAKLSPAFKPKLSPSSRTKLSSAVRPKLSPKKKQKPSPQLNHLQKSDLSKVKKEPSHSILSGNESEDSSDFEGFDNCSSESGIRSQKLQKFVDVLQYNTWFNDDRFSVPLDQLCDWNDDQLTLSLFEKG